MPEMTRIDSFPSRFIFFSLSCTHISFPLSLSLVSCRDKKRKFSSKLWPALCRALRIAARQVRASIFLSGPQCNFRLFIAFRASLGGGMDSETRATSQARLPRSARRRYRKLAPCGHVSPRVANYFSRFTLRKYYGAKICLLLFWESYIYK